MSTLYFTGCALPPEFIRGDGPSEDTIYPTPQELAHLRDACIEICVEDDRLEPIGQTIRWSLQGQPPRLLVAGMLFPHQGETENIRQDPGKWGLGLVLRYGLDGGRAMNKRVAKLLFTKQPLEGGNVDMMTTSWPDFNEHLTTLFLSLI